MVDRITTERRKVAWDKPRPFKIKVDGRVIYRLIADRIELEEFRKLGYQIEPILHIDSAIYGVSYVELPEGKGSRSCEMCEDSQNSIMGIMRGDRRVELSDGSSRIVCHFHNPIEKEREVYRG